MPDTRDDVQRGGRPRLSQFPRDVGWAAQIQAPVNQYGWDVRDSGDAVEKFTFGAPRRVSPVVSDSACKAHSKPRIGVARFRAGFGREVDVAFLPVTPIAGGIFADIRVGAG